MKQIIVIALIIISAQCFAQEIAKVDTVAINIKLAELANRFARVDSTINLLNQEKANIIYTYNEFIKMKQEQ